MSRNINNKFPGVGVVPRFFLHLYRYVWIIDIERPLQEVLLKPIQVWQSEFKSLLRIRKSNHHSKCNQCIRHRLIIRKLGFCIPAKRAQVAELEKHLRRQYLDRQSYWHSRSLSRLSGSSSCPAVVTAIIDSMEAAKHSWPKTTTMNAKEFANWSRPRLSSTTLLIHGFLALTILSPHFVTCNSSRSIEIISHGLTLVSQNGYDLRSTHLVLQGDNASKELKNNGLLQWASTQVALGRIKECTLSFLSSGHSHEDIDGCFSNMATWLNRSQQLLTPAAFQHSLQGFMDVKENRPYEPLRQVLIMSRFRDWILFSKIQHSIFMWQVFSSFWHTQRNQEINLFLSGPHCWLSSYQEELLCRALCI